MSGGTHRCETMTEVENLGRMLNVQVRSTPTVVSVTRFRATQPSAPGWGPKTAWLLQLCAGTVNLMVCVNFCPFCGADLERPE